MTLHARAGKLALPEQLVDIDKLLAAYVDNVPDASVPAQRVAFGTSGHRGTSFDRSFNEHHVLAITQAICAYRKAQGIDGPLHIGFDSHALSRPAFETALQVLAANGVQTLIASNDDYTPTPAVSLAILNHNRNRTTGLADGIVVTPSHNPPDSGGFKYNAINGGPADTGITKWIENEANRLLLDGLSGVRRVSIGEARTAATTHQHDYLSQYVSELAHVIDFDVIRSAAIRLGVDPLGGAGVAYWPRIAEAYRIDLDVVSQKVDPTFRFMTLDWDGKIRMDPSSAYAMQPLIAMKDNYDIAFACDTDHDRHGIVAPSVGLMPSNHYLSVAIDYLYRHREGWRKDAAVGKTLVSSSMIDRVTERLGRRLHEVPVGFKYFVDGLFDGSLAFGGEESAGASFSRLDGSCWTTDKDGMSLALLSAEITARAGRDPGQYYQSLTAELGNPVSDRVEAAANAEQKKKLSRLSPGQIKSDTLAGEKIVAVLDRAPGNGEAVGGIKVVAANGWFAARPSGTEDIYKIYAESFHGPAHLATLLGEAQVIVDTALAAD